MMQVVWVLMVLIGLVCGIGGVQAQSTKLTPLQTSPITLNSIAWGLTPPLQTYNFTVPSLSTGQSLALEFEARADRDPDGSNLYLNIYVNGQRVTVAADRLNTRLLNKPVLIPIDIPGLFWGDSNSWRLMWARNFTDDFSYGSQSYRFVVDISDLVRSGRNNTVSFQHNNSGNSIPIVLQNVRVGSVPSPKRRMPYTIAGAPITPTANVRSDGGLKVAIGKTTLPIASFFSVPGGGWKRLGPVTGTTRTKEAIGSVTSSVTGGVTTVKMNLPAYNLSRAVSIINGSIKVKDTLTNKTAADIGMMIAHEAKFPGALGTVLLEGKADPSIREVCSPMRPTVTVPLGAASVHLIAYDDILRNQAIEYVRGNNKTVGLRTERLVLPAKGSKTLEWTVMALPGSDEFDMVNRVRADWGVPLQQLDGPVTHNIFMFDKSMTEDDWRAFGARTNLRAIICAGGWVDERKPEPHIVGFGTGLATDYFADWRARFTEQTAMLHRAVPGIKVTLYNHYYLQDPDRDAFPDSWVTQGDGSYPKYHTGARTVLPTATSPFGVAMKNMMNGQLTEMGVDGFMLDETQGPSPLYSELGMNAQVDYSRWDGCSAILDPTTFAIKQKIAYIALLSEEFEKNLISDYAAQRGLLVVANGAPTTRSRNRDAAMHMVETDSHGIEDTMRLHFTTPLAYFYPGRYDVAYLQRLLERGALPWFTSPSDQLAITRRFFPITVQELRKGWIKGKERVITMNPGSYGWTGETYQYLIWRYAADGTLVGGAPLTGQAKGLVDVQLPLGGIAVLERGTPLTGVQSPQSGD